MGLLVRSSAMQSSMILAMESHWKLFDALLAFTRSGKYEEYVFGNTEKQKYLGTWKDGTPIRALEISVPQGNGVLSLED